MNNDYNKLYGKGFYGQHGAGMSRSAEVILDLIYNVYTPESVIDIGCGQGAWLRAAESCGATTLKGFDGNWVKKEDLLSGNIDFVPVDLSVSLPELKEKYDLCISLEVAEHLAEENAESFVELLCQASDTILFGAAIPYQGGTNHINEQWQTYWIELFQARGFECVDCIRGAVWKDESVEWWYKQNTFLFIGPDNAVIKAEELKKLEKPLLDVVHPTHYEEKFRVYQRSINNPTFRFCARCLKRWLGARLRGHR